MQPPPWKACRRLPNLWLTRLAQTRPLRILPAIYSDSYVALMPGESCTIVTEVNEADARGETPAIVVA